MTIYTHARYVKDSCECSSKGDKRFSALYDVMPDGRSRTQY